MSQNAYFISTAEQFHDPPEEIGLHLVAFSNILKTHLYFPLDKPNQVLLLHPIAATDV